MRAAPSPVDAEPVQPRCPLPFREFGLSFGAPHLARLRRSRTVVIGLTLLLAACTSSQPGPGRRQASPSSQSPPGSHQDSWQLSCQQGIPIGSAARSSNDLVIGRLSYPRLLLGFSGDAPMTESNFPGGGYFYKVGTELAPGATVTVSIDEPARGYAAIVSMYSPHAGDQSIMYQSCSKSQYGTAWIGGFLLQGRKTACVPLVIKFADESQARRTVISLGAGRCS